MVALLPFCSLCLVFKEEERRSAMAGHCHYIVILVLISLTSIGDHTWACESWCSQRCMAQCYNFKGLNCWSFVVGGCCLTDCQRMDCMFQCPPPPASESDGSRRRKRTAWGLEDNFKKVCNSYHITLLSKSRHHLEFSTLSPIAKTHPAFSNVYFLKCSSHSVWKYRQI